MQYSASDEKREIANRLYTNEEHLWANLVRQYYSPFGAPMRLARPLLEQWHIKNDSGIKDPDEIEGCTVQVMLSGDSFIIKRFVTTASAEKYIAELKWHDIECNVVDREEMFNFER